MGCRRPIMPFTQRKKTTCRKSSDRKPKGCCACAVAALDQHLAIPIQGKLTQIDLFQALVGMAAMQQSAHSITKLLEHVPCETSVRYHLKKLGMDELEQKERCSPHSPRTSCPQIGNVYRFASDCTRDPYILQSRISGYGRPQRSFRDMKERQGHPSSSALWSDHQNYSTQQLLWISQSDINYKFPLTSLSALFFPLTIDIKIFSYVGTSRIDLHSSRREINSLNE